MIFTYKPAGFLKLDLSQLPIGTLYQIEPLYIPRGDYTYIWVYRASERLVKFGRRPLPTDFSLTLHIDEGLNVRIIRTIK